MRGGGREEGREEGEEEGRAWREWRWRKGRKYLGGEK